MAAEGPLRFEHALYFEIAETRSWAQVAATYPNWLAVREAYENWAELRRTLETIGTATLPEAHQAGSYSATVRVAGGTPPYEIQAVGGQLPQGLQLEGDEIAGTPPELESTRILLEARDAEGSTTRAYFRVTVVEAPPVPPPLPPPVPPRPRLELVLDGGPALDFDELEMLHITEVDYGFPEVREVVDDRVEADGMVDQTRFFGSRVVTLTGKVAIDWESRGRRQPTVDALAPFLVPDRRPWLYSRFDDGTVKRIALRADQFSRPQIANVQDISFSFKSPTGVLEGDPARELRMVPEVALAGREYDLVHDRVYPPGSGTSWLAENRGNARADWVARIFGPCEGPAVENVTLGQSVDLADLELAEGEYVEVDSRERTVLANGLREASRWQYLDFVATTWWRLPAGTSVLRFHCHDWASPAQILFSWRDTSLL